MFNPENSIVKECELTTPYPYYDLRDTRDQNKRIFNLLKNADISLSELLVQKPANFTSPLEMLAQIISNKK